MPMSQYPHGTARAAIVDTVWALCICYLFVCIGADVFNVSRRQRHFQVHGLPIPLLSRVYAVRNLKRQVRKRHRATLPATDNTFLSAGCWRIVNGMTSKLRQTWCFGLKAIVLTAIYLLLRRSMGFLRNNEMYGFFFSFSLGCHLIWLCIRII